VITKDEGGGFCASLFSKRSLEITAPDYGFGPTPEAAAGAKANATRKRRRERRSNRSLEDALD
jgi:hypothetical protein